MIDSVYEHICHVLSINSGCSGNILQGKKPKKESFQSPHQITGFTTEKGDHTSNSQW